MQMAGKVAATFLGVVITILLTNYLGPAGFGVYTAITVFVLLFGSLADWGLSLITVREAAKNEREANQIIGNVLLVRLVLTLGAVLVVNLLVHFWPTLVISPLPSGMDVPRLVLITSFFLLAISLKTSFQIIFNVRLAMQNSAISDLTANVVAIGLILFLTMQRAGLEEILWAFNVGHFLAAGVAAVLGFKMLRLDFKWLAGRSKFLLREALPMGSILIIFTIYNRVDTVILAHFRPEAEVGYYGLAYRIYEVLVQGAAFFANAVLPILSGLALTDRKRMAEIYNKSWVILMVMGMAVAGVNFVLSPLLPVVFKGFSGSVVAMQILSLSLMVSYLNHLNGYTIIALGKQWWSLGIAVVALMVNVGLNLWLIPLFSYPAAAFITFVTEGLIVVLSMKVIGKELEINLSPAKMVRTIEDLVSRKEKLF